MQWMIPVACWGPEWDYKGADPFLRGWERADPFMKGWEGIHPFLRHCPEALFPCGDNFPKGIIKLWKGGSAWLECFPWGERSLWERAERMRRNHSRMWRGDHTQVSPVVLWVGFGGDQGEWGWQEGVSAWQCPRVTESLR